MEGDEVEMMEEAELPDASDDTEKTDSDGGQDEEEEEDEEDEYRCKHYRRKCQFVTPCCGGKLYRCRFCHDDEENHTLRRDDVTEIECSVCGLRQAVQQSCEGCGTQFGRYFCFDCKLYDDEDKQQFHCVGCGICRVGGRENYFHCDRCDMCLPNHLEGAHKCVERVSRSNCPVCQEDIHTSRIPSQIPPCNHLIHKTCFDDMVSHGQFACPVCGVSMMNMADVWGVYDQEIAETPMPEEYRDLLANILCRDCNKTSVTPFHVLGLRCAECGSYNTARDRGPLIRRASATPPPPGLAITPPLSPSASAPIPAVSASTASFTMTPEPSPLRLERVGVMPLLPRMTAPNVSSIARRISFSEQEEGVDEDITDPS